MAVWNYKFPAHLDICNGCWSNLDDVDIGRDGERIVTAIACHGQTALTIVL
jgi:hypothetical protein